MCEQGRERPPDRRSSTVVIANLKEIFWFFALLLLDRERGREAGMHSPMALFVRKCGKSFERTEAVL